MGGLLHLMLGVAWAGWAPRAAEEAAYGRAVAALGAGRVEDAAAGFQAVLRADPSCGMAAQGLGVALLRAGRSADAEALLAQAAASYAEAPVWVSLSAARFVRQDWAGAAAAARRALEIEADSIDAHAALLQVHLRTGDAAGAAAVVAAAERALPAPVAACFAAQVAAEAGDAPGAAAGGACAAAGLPDWQAALDGRAAGGALDAAGDAAARLGVDPVVGLGQAAALHEDGDLAGARAVLDGVVAGWPHRVDARLLRAQVRRDQGDAAGAAADLEAALAGGAWVDAHRGGGVSGVLRASDAAALEVDRARAAGALAGLRLDAGDGAGAAAALERAAGLPAVAAVEAARARLRLAAGDAPGAARVLEGAWSRWPGDTDLRGALGRLAVEAPAAVPPALAGALAERGDWADQLNLAVGAAKAGDAAGCAAAAARGLERAAGPAGRAALAKAGLPCAAEQGDLASAERFWAAAPGAEWRPVTRYNFARLRLEAGDAGGAWVALAPAAARPPEGEVGGAILTLGVRLRAAAGDFAVAERLGADARVPAAELRAAAAKARALGKSAEAARLEALAAGR